MLIEELIQHWGIKRNGRCHCGCAKPTKGYFVPGHDAKFAANLLSVLRGNDDVASAIRQLAEGIPGPE